MFFRRLVRWLLILVAVIFVVVYLVFIYIVDYSPYVYGVQHADEIVAGGMQLMDLVPEGAPREQILSCDERIPESLEKMDATGIWVSHDEVIFLAWRSVFYVYRTPPTKVDRGRWRITDRLYWNGPS